MVGFILNKDNKVILYINISFAFKNREPKKWSPPSTYYLTAGCDLQQQKQDNNERYHLLESVHYLWDNLRGAHFRPYV